MQQLGSVADPRVTDALFAELDRVGVEPAAAAVLQAIGRHPRGNVVPRLRAVLVHPDAGDPVRQAAAVAIGKQGTRGVDLLLDCANGDAGATNAVADAALQGLAAANDDRAWRGLAPMALKGGTAQQLRVLRMLEPVGDLDAVTRVRERLLEDNSPDVAALAWRQLVQMDHAGARDATAALLERLGAAPPPAARAELVTGLSRNLEPALYPEFLTLACADSSLVSQALQRSLPKLAANDAFVQWLADQGWQEGGDARRTAFRILRAVPRAKLLPQLRKVRAAVRPPKAETLDLALSLHALLQDDASWRDEVLTFVSSTDAAVRTAGLTMLLQSGDGRATAAAIADLDSKSWESRAAAIRYLTRFRSLDAIPPLMARADKETGRLADELNECLFVHTGTRVWKRSEWEAWWQRNRTGHQLPPEAAVRTVAKAGTGGGTVAYFGIPLVSTHVAFLIDVSGSMSANIGTDKKRTRLDEAKRQLRSAIEKLDSEREFNVIVYESGVHPYWDGIRKAKGKDKEDAMDRTAKLAIRGGTNICDALERAFADPAVDTIYLLTDGQPSAGRITDVQELADEVRRWNYRRQIVIHCIALGEDSVLLKRLSKESGGSYVFVR